MISPATILNLCEQLVPTEKKVETYINPLIKYMTDEWKVIKVRIANYMVLVASGEINEAKNDIWFPEGKQNLIFQQYDNLIKSFKSEINDRIRDITKEANIDANMKGVAHWTDTTPLQVVLSKEGVEDVIKELKWQKDFVDDFSKDTKTRIIALLKSRYGSLGEFRANVNRTFRIDRDVIIDRFKNEVYDHADKVIDGKMSVDDFVSAMKSSIEDHYKRAFKAGKGVQILDELDEELILRQVQGQMQYLNNFAQYIKQRQAMGKNLTSQIRTRAGLYAERVSAIFEAGAISAMPADVLLDWKMNPAEHCTTCPIYASNSPYTKQTLPGFPGEGFHLTLCGTNCQCQIVISDLYVTQKDLGIGREFTPIPYIPIISTEIKASDIEKAVERKTKTKKSTWTTAKEVRENFVNKVKSEQSSQSFIQLKNELDEAVKRREEIGHALSSETITEAFELDDKIKILKKEYEKEHKKQIMKMREYLYYDKKGFDIPFKNNSKNKSLELHAKKNFAEISKFINKDKLIIKDVDVEITKGREKSIGSAIWINNKSPDHVIGHEYGHVLEETNQKVFQKTYQFLEDRTKGESPVPLKQLCPEYAYGPNEVAKKDKFIDPYMGKIYVRKATEILSMGIDMLMQDPYKLATEDPEYFDLIISILHGID